MSENQQDLVIKALRKHGKVLPCGTRQTLADCFTEEKGRLVFWFNTDDGSTHVESASAA